MNELKKMLDLCKKREEEWPKRGSNYLKFIEYISHLEKYVIDSAKNNKTKYNCTKQIDSRKFFIFGSMKSGTTLLLNILDGHSRIGCLPVDSHLVKHFNSNPNVDKEKLFKDLHGQWFRKLISPTGQSPFLILGNDIENYVKFSSLMYENFISSDLMNFKPFDITSKAYIESCQYFKKNKKIIILEKTPENEFYYDTIAKEYPESKFLHIVRNPVDNIISLKKNAINLNYNFNFRGAFINIINSMSLALKRKDKENYKVVKYESLTSKLNETTQDICNFLDINNEEILSSPTFLSKNVKNNSMFSENNKKTGVFINKSRRNTDYNKLFDEDEKLMLEAFLKNNDIKNILSFFNYE